MLTTTSRRQLTNPSFERVEKQATGSWCWPGWGLVPFFTKQLSDIEGLTTINARAETITKAPTWREPFRKRRCLVPANAFYEWPKAGDPPKQPYALELSNGGPMAFAGLWDAWEDKEGHWLQSFAIVTTAANELLAWMQMRMPVILEPRE